MKDSAIVIVAFVGTSIGFVALMNWLGGAKYIIGNRIVESWEKLKKAYELLSD